MMSLAYPVDRLDWALFNVQCWNIVPSLVSSFEKKIENQAFILPCNLPAFLIIFAGWDGAGNPPPTCGAGRPSLIRLLLALTL